VPNSISAAYTSLDFLMEERYEGNRTLKIEARKSILRLEQILVPFDPRDL
jgi:hypothetical protein